MKSATAVDSTNGHTLITSIRPDVLMGAFTQLLLVQPGHVMPGEKTLSNCGRAQAGWIGENALIDADLIFVSNDQLAQQTVGEIMSANRKEECDQCFVHELDLPAQLSHSIHRTTPDRFGNLPLVNPQCTSRSLFGKTEAGLLKCWAVDTLEAMLRKSGDKYDIWGIVATTHVVGVPMLAWLINEILGDRNPNYAENKSLIELLMFKNGESLRLEFLEGGEAYSMKVLLFTPPMGAQ